MNSNGIGDFDLPSASVSTSSAVQQHPLLIIYDRITSPQHSMQHVCGIPVEQNSSKGCRVLSINLIHKIQWIKYHFANACWKTCTEYAIAAEYYPFGARNPLFFSHFLLALNTFYNVSCMFYRLVCDAEERTKYLFCENVYLKHHILPKWMWI